MNRGPDAGQPGRCRSSRQGGVKGSDSTVLTADTEQSPGARGWLRSPGGRDQRPTPRGPLPGLLHSCERPTGIGGDPPARPLCVPSCPKWRQESGRQARQGPHMVRGEQGASGGGSDQAVREVAPICVPRARSWPEGGFVKRKAKRVRVRSQARREGHGNTTTRGRCWRSATPLDRCRLNADGPGRGHHPLGNYYGPGTQGAEARAGNRRVLAAVRDSQSSSTDCGVSPDQGHLL